MSRTIAFVGLSGAGKSTLGRALAARLAVPLLDTDALIEQIADMSIPGIFAAHGEEHFRELETRALAEALNNSPTVVATGGGIVLRPANRSLLRLRSFVVWLDAPTEALVARLRADDQERPLLAVDDPAARLEALRTLRTPLYAEVAHLRLPTEGRAIGELVAEILEMSASRR